MTTKFKSLLALAITTCAAAGLAIAFTGPTNTPGAANSSAGSLMNQIAGSDFSEPTDSLAALSDKITSVQSSQGITQPGQGSDMWTAYFSEHGMFNPHTNDCSGTEAFVKIAGSGTGYCIEIDERTTASWIEAREACAALGKRLPELGEFKYACQNAGSLGLNNMTNDPEWSSNFLIDGSAAKTAGYYSGTGGCNYGSTGGVNNYQGSESTFSFRCVH